MHNAQNIQYNKIIIGKVDFFNYKKIINCLL